MSPTTPDQPASAAAIEIGPTGTSKTLPVLPLCLLLALLCGFAAWFLAPNPVKVSTLLRVPAGAPYIVRTSEPIPDLAAHQRNQKALARSRLVLNSALRDPKVSKLAVIKGKVEPVTWLEKELHVDFATAPEIMRIWMVGQGDNRLMSLVNAIDKELIPNPPGGDSPANPVEELVVIVDAIRQAYLHEVVDREQTARRNREEFLKGMIRTYETKLKEAKAHQHDFEQRIDGAGADFRAHLIAFVSKQLAMVETELLACQSEMRKAKLLHATLKERQLKSQDARISEEQIAEAVNKDQDIISWQTEIRGIEARIEKKLALSPPEEQELAVLQDRKEVAKLNAKVKERSDRLRPQVVKQLRDRAAIDLHNRGQTLEEQIAYLEKSEPALSQDADSLRKRLFDINRTGAKPEVSKEDISHLVEMTRRLKMEQEALQVELNAPSRIQEIESATVTPAEAGPGEWLTARLAILTAVAFVALGLVGWLRPRSQE